MPAPRHPLRKHIVTLFKRGELVSVHEAALICDASRQAITKWLRAAGIDIEACRLEHLARLRGTAQRHIEAMGDRPRQSAKARWRETRRAVRRFNGANATDQGQP